MNVTLLRLRVFVSDRRAVLTVTAVLLVAAGAGVFLAYADGTTEEVRIVESGTLSGEPQHEAGVRNGSVLYGGNETLRNRPVYYTDVSPVFDAEYAVTLDAESADDVAVGLNATLVYGAKDDGFLWRETERLDNVTAAGVGVYDVVTSEFSVNITDVRQRIEEVESNLGASVGENVVYVKVDVAVDGEIEGRQRERSLTDRINVSYADGTYTVEADGFEETFEDRRTVTVETESPATTGGGAAAGAGVLLFLAVLASAVFSPTREQRNRLSYRRDLDEYADLVVRADPGSEIPDDIADGPTVEVERLADLAGLALDTRSAVLEDPDERRYLVRVDGVVYVYEPP